VASASDHERTGEECRPGGIFGSGVGLRILAATLDETGPISVLRAALYQRFSSRGDADFADKFLFAMRYEFGAEEEWETGPKGA
jgi:6-phosphogluconate dehydrogenase